MKRLLLLAALLCSPLALAGADGIYTYVEKDGTVIYTNVPPGGAKKARKLQGSFKPAPSAARSPSVPRARRVSNAQINEAISLAAQRYRIPEGLVRAIMHAESNFNPTALSHKGASGLMQLMPATATDMYVRDIFDVRQNIEGGVRYLRVLANMYDGDMVKMIAAYNAGPEAVKRYGGKVPPYQETQAYVRKVLQLYYQYKGEEPQQAAAPESP
jgi:soluble lytic murein transglycosylase-like protein